MVEVELKVQVAILVVIDTILINWVEDMIVILVHQVEVMVVLQTNHFELVQIFPHPQSLKGDVGVTDIQNSMIN